MPVLRASEIGVFLYCARAWWYQRRGVASDNAAELADGRELHQRHGRAVLTSGFLRLAGYLAFLLAVIFLAAFFALEALSL